MDKYLEDYRYRCFDTSSKKMILIFKYFCPKVQKLCKKAPISFRIFTAIKSNQQFSTGSLPTKMRHSTRRLQETEIC